MDKYGAPKQAEYLEALAHGFDASEVNIGQHTIYTGGGYDSYLLVPVIPPEKGHERNGMKPVNRTMIDIFRVSRF